MLYARRVPDRRSQVADAALRVVAESGLKGLTHRAVDSMAAVPAGTTSNYFRTRESLVDGVIGLMEERDLDLWRGMSAAAPPADLRQAAEAVATMVLGLVQDQAVTTRARLALSLDRPDAVAAAHYRFLERADAVLRHLGVPDTAARSRAAADFADGLIFHALTSRRAEPLDRGEIVATLLRILGPS